MFAELAREFRFAWGESTFRWTVLLALVFSSFALLVGSLEIEQQKDELTELVEATLTDQAVAQKGKTDPGDTAYYVFHLTYDAPSSLAFAALGLRDELPWKHRLRMLAFEGQIHETDARNPELSVLGQLDFTYLVSVLLPLFVIGLLFDLVARERREARYELICATSVYGHWLFLIRALVRVLVLFVAIVVPFLVVAALSGVGMVTSLLVLGVVLLHILFWTFACRLFSMRKLEGITVAVSLLSLWFLLTIVVPVVGKAGVEQALPVPNGGDILLLQRETVNSAWDLPKKATMDPFVELYPEWKDGAQIEKPFEWKWYYAFQEIGDQVARPISTALYDGMVARHDAMGKVAILSPALMSERALVALAQTDVLQHLQYVQCAREFHSSLRHFYYSMLFGQKPYSEDALVDRPVFQPCL